MSDDSDYDYEEYYDVNPQILDDERENRRERYVDSYSPVMIPRSISPLNSEERRYYNIARDKEEYAERMEYAERIKREAEIYKPYTPDRSKWREAVNQWKLRTGRVINDLPEAPLKQEYDFMLDETRKEIEERQEKERIEAIKNKELADIAWNSRVKTKKYKGNAKGDVTVNRTEYKNKKTINLNPTKTLEDTKTLETAKTLKRPDRIIKSNPNLNPDLNTDLNPDYDPSLYIKKGANSILDTIRETFDEIDNKIIKTLKPQKPKAKILDIETFLKKPSVLFFSWKSDNQPAGEGPNEILGSENLHKLNNQKDWRKKLSNTWKAPFILDGKKWQTVEHYLQSKKFTDPKIIDQFSMDSGSDMSTNPIEAIRVGFNTKTSRAGNYPKNLPTYLLLSTYSKFSQDIYLKDLLLKTKDSELWARADNPNKNNVDRRAVWLEKVRFCLNEVEDTNTVTFLNSKNVKLF